MKVAVIVGLIFAVSLRQADSRFIANNDDRPKILQETSEQAYTCAKKMGLKALKIPKLRGLEPRPEDNEALNELLGCIWVKRGVLSEAGDIDSDKFEAFLLEEYTIFKKANEALRSLAHEVATTCKTVQGENYGQTAVKIENCVNRCLKNKLRKKVNEI